MSANFHELTKTTNEKYTYTIDFTGRLPTGATLSSVAAVAKEEDTEEIVTSTLLQGTPASVNSGTNILSVNFNDAGTADTAYLIRCIVTLSSGAKLEEVIRLKIVDYYR